MVEDLHDALQQEDMKGFCLTAIDPGRATVFTSASKENDGDYQMRRITRKEYDTYSGSKRITQEEAARCYKENMFEVFQNKPTAKTVSISKYAAYVEYAVLNMQKYFSYYSKDTCKSRFNLYQGRQRAIDEMGNVLLDGGRKYNKKKRKNTRKNRKGRKKDAMKKKISRGVKLKKEETHSKRKKEDKA
jgi:hypothetical protein